MNIRLFNQCVVCGQSFQHYSEFETHYKLHIPLTSNCIESADYNVTVHWDDNIYDRQYCNSIIENENIIERGNFRNEGNNYHGTKNTVNMVCDTSEMANHSGSMMESGNDTIITINNVYGKDNTVIKTSNNFETTNNCYQDVMVHNDIFCRKEISNNICDQVEIEQNASDKDINGYFCIEQNIFNSDDVGTQQYSNDGIHEDSMSNSEENPNMADQSIISPQVLHKRPKRHGCDVCGRTFSKPFNLRVHSRTHTGEKPFHCDMCDAMFACSSSLKRHGLKHMGTKPFGCDVCSKTFATSSELQIHYRTHSGEKPFECGICNKMFANSSNLHQHMIRHSLENKFICVDCGKSFRSKALLQRHTKTHVEEKLFKCLVCAKAFTTRSYQLTHIRGHTKKDPSYRCDICSNFFSSSSYLRIHMRTHYGDKPYKCDVCGKDFNQKSNLQTHLRLHSGEKPYSCGLCNKSFFQNSHLIYHLSQKHS